MLVAFLSDSCIHNNEQPAHYKLKIDDTQGQKVGSESQTICNDEEV